MKNVYRNDYLVKPLSNDKVREIAIRARKSFGIGGDSFNIIECLRAKHIDTVVGRKTLNVEIRPDHEMGSDDAVTIVESQQITIRIRVSVWTLLDSDPRTNVANISYYRARWTLAHELGHAVLNHDRGPMARATVANATIKSHPVIRPFESAEHQADQFALAFLVDIKLAKTCRSAEEISRKYSINISAAKALFEELHKGKSQIVIDGFAELMRSFGRPVPTTTNVIPCSICGEPMATSAGGNRSSCESCGRAGDRLEEGDSFYW